MSIESSVSMRELELEGAELLPNRETLCVPQCYSPCSPCGPSLFIGVGVVIAL